MYYQKLLPITSFRRFVVDQILSWLSVCLYYIFLTICIIVIAMTAINLLGFIAIHFIDFHLNEKMKEYPYVEHFVIGLTVIWIGAIIALIIMGAHTFFTSDYKKWMKKQTDQSEGNIDEEALLIETRERVGLWTKFYDMYFPTASLQRYVSRVFFYGFLIFAVVAIQFIFTAYYFIQFDKAPALANWFIGTCLELAIIACTYLIYDLTHETCRRDYLKFVSQTHSAITHKNI